MHHAKLNALAVKAAVGTPVACLKEKDLNPYYFGSGVEIYEDNKPVVYTDPSVPVERHVDDLVRRMSLYEKVNQLMNAMPEIKRLGVPM